MLLTDHAYSSANITTIPSGLRAPLEFVRELSGDAGYGRSVPHALPTSEGVIVNQRGCVRLLTQDLSDELWRQETDDWGAGPFLDTRRDMVWVGPIAGFLRGYRLRTGEAVARIPFEGAARLCAIHDGRYFVKAPESKALVSIDDAGMAHWRREAKAPSLIVDAATTTCTRMSSHACCTVSTRRPAPSAGTSRPFQARSAPRR
jgi:hypothetical protein